MKKLLLALAFCAAPLTAHAQLPAMLSSWVTPSAGQQLDQFFWGDLNATGPYTFGLWTFDGTSLTSPVLWEGTGLAPITQDQVQQVNVGGLMLAGNTRYAIGVYTSNGYGQGTIGLSSCAPGDGAYLNVNTSYIHQDCWAIPGFGFAAQGPVISATPEPATLALMGTGLFAILAVSRRRRIPATMATP